MDGGVDECQKEGTLGAVGGFVYAMLQSSSEQFAGVALFHLRVSVSSALCSMKASPRCSNKPRLVQIADRDILPWRLLHLHSSFIG
jgi:hypothetical protein